MWILGIDSDLQKRASTQLLRHLSKPLCFLVALNGLNEATYILVFINLAKRLLIIKHLLKDPLLVKCLGTLVYLAKWEHKINSYLVKGSQLP